MTEHDIRTYLPEIVDTMNDGLFLTRPDGTIVMINRALTRITGYTLEELRDQTCAVFECDVCERSRSEGRHHWCRLFDSEGESMRDCRIRRKDGAWVHVVKNASLLRDERGKVLGAVETLTDISALDERDRRIRTLSRLLDAPEAFHGIVGRSEPMRRLFALLEKAAQSDAPAILYGESGTGKELAARAIHDLGPRASGPFVPLNCAAINESLLESEIFGHVKGAFTGAYRHRVGRFEEAAGGAVFLDEIGDVPLSIQVKLLRVLETRSFERLGDNRPLALDARIITATHQDLRRLVAEGRFREDFFYRINVIPIHLPPLRERREDIPLLARHFARRPARRDANGPEAEPHLSPAALEALTAYPWPGNVRELKSAMEYALVLCDGPVIELEHLPPHIVQNAPAASGSTAASGVPTTNTDGIPLHSDDPSALRPRTARGGDPAERQALIDALRAAGGNKSEAARRLGVSRVTVQNRMRKYGLNLTPVLSD